MARSAFRGCGVAPAGTPSDFVSQVSLPGSGERVDETGPEGLTGSGRSGCRGRNSGRGWPSPLAKICWPRTWPKTWALANSFAVVEFGTDRHLPLTHVNTLQGLDWPARGTNAIAAPDQPPTVAMLAKIVCRH